jgi:spore coat protein CotH
LAKKSHLKIAFDEFDNNQTLDGLKKINLNNFTNDPSLMHDVIAFKLFRDAGLVASRTSYAKLIVNGEYIGVYVIIENVDKTFLKSYFGSAQNDGNLYKTDRGAAVYLNWLGTTSAGYKDQGLKLNTNETADDWTKLINFIDFINNNNDADFKQQLESKFDVHAYLKILGH